MNLQNYPLLTQKEETELFQAYAKTKCQKSKDKIVLSHMRLVMFHANKFKGYKLPLDDLVQEGTVGLLKAVDTFNINLGNKFSTFAIYYIKASQFKYIMDNVKIVRFAKSKPMMKLFFNFREIRSKLNTDNMARHLTLEQLEDIAKELNVPLKDVQEINSQLTFGDISIDYTNDDDENDIINYPFLLDETYTPNKIIKNYQYEHLISTTIPDTIKTLDTRSQKIIHDRFMTDTPKSRTDISKDYGISQQRIAQIESKALLKIRENLLENSYWI